MYTISLQHNLTVAHVLPFESAPENTVHTHRYTVEIIVDGPHLDDNGFLLDVIDLKQRLRRVTQHFEGRLLNEMEEFTQLVPTMETMAKVFWDALRVDLQDSAETLTVHVWEDPTTFAGFTGPVHG